MCHQTLGFDGESLDDVGNDRGRNWESHVIRAAGDSSEIMFVDGDPRGSYELGNGSMVCCYAALGLSDQVRCPLL